MEKIMVPEFVKGLNEEQVRNLLAGINIGTRQVLLEQRDENGKLIGSKMMLSLASKKRYLDALSEVLESLNNDKSMDIILKSKYKHMIKKFYNEISGLKHFINVMDGNEEYNGSYEDVKADLANIARVKSYRKVNANKKNN